MGFRLSTGLRNAMLGTDGFKTALALGKIKIFSGAIPSDADSAEGSGTLLLTITKEAGATGLTLNAAASGSITKSSEEWKGDGVADGTAAWFRFYDAAGTTGASTTAVRIDGLVGTSSADLVLSTISIQTGVPVTIDSATFTLPAS